MPKVPLMFVDIEAGRDQAYIWLISVLIEGRPDSFRSFYAETTSFEKDMLNHFLSYRRTFNDCTICHYGGFDERLMLRQLATYGLDCGGLVGWFDLQSAVKKSGIFPLKHFSLGKVTDHLGYKPRHPGLNGSSVPGEYERVVCQRDEAGAKMLREYGEDDVRVMQWIVSALDGTGNISLDRSWTAPERMPPPPSFEEQCALAKYLNANGMNKRHIADRLGISMQYVNARLQEKPEEWKGREVSFESGCAIPTGIPVEGAGSECDFGACIKDGVTHGVVIEQVTEKAFRVRTDEAVFQVHKDRLNRVCSTNHA